MARRLTDAPAPFVAIPTTAGTGSEATRNAVLLSPEHRVKVSLRSPLMLPMVALVDPELTYESAARHHGGHRNGRADPVDRAVRLFARANPMTDSLCTEGIRRAARSLRKAFEGGSNDAARLDMAVASLFGGMALANAGLGAVHGLAGPIGGMFPGAPHGAVCAALLPHVVTANLAALRTCDRRSEALAPLRTGGGASHRPAQRPRPKPGVEWLQSLVLDLGIPPLASYGITEQHVPDLVERAAGASSMRANPVALTTAELSAVVRAGIGDLGRSVRRGVAASGAGQKGKREGGHTAWPPSRDASSGYSEVTGVPAIAGPSTPRWCR